MTKLATALLVVLSSALFAENVNAEPIGHKWMQFLEGDWEYEFKTGDVVEKGTVSWRIAADGKAGTGIFAQEGGYTALEIGGCQTDSDAALQVTGYNNEGGYWSLEYTEITADLKVAGPMHGVDNGVAHKGAISGGKIAENQVEFNYEGKTVTRDVVNWTMTARRKTSQAMPQQVRESLGKLVGTWQIETIIDGQLIKEKVTAKWSADKNAVHYEGKGVSFAAGTPLTFSGIIGWDGSKGIVVERGFNSTGGTAYSTHDIQGESWISQTEIQVAIDGKTQIERLTRTLTWQSEDQWTLTATNRTLAGKAQKDRTSVFRRVEQ